MKKKIIALIISGILVVASTGCNDGDFLRYANDPNLGSVTDASQTTTAVGQVTTSEGVTPVLSNVEFAQGRSTQLAVSSDGKLSIARKTRTSTAKMGSGNWTIFVYMCGTDLESSGSGLASEDLDEMISATRKASNLQFVVETGGAADWYNSKINANENQRFLISGGKMTEVDSQRESNMGSKDTLSAFLSWGVANYPAQYMGVVLWNHGGGSISGVCFDENADYDSLTLREIETAFDSVFDKMTDKFEFVGFDACLMGTIETANILEPHANYMYASQELESGMGWDYNYIGSCLKGNPSANGLEVGKVVCDGYYDSCTNIGEENEATLSVIDLSKLNAFLVSFNDYANALYAAAGDNQTLVKILRNINGVENYGGNNRTEGYTNMVDLGGIITSTSQIAGSALATTAINDLNKCVVYSVKGSSRPDGMGLSVYYPLSVQGSGEISIFKDIAISPYYISFVDLVAYGSSSSGDVSSYDDSEWFGDNSIFWNNDTSSNGSWTDYWGSDGDNSDYSYNFDSNSTSISYSVNPHMNDDGYYTFTVSNESIYYLDRVYCNIMMSYEDNNKEYMLDLGTDDYVDVNWSTGEVIDNFDGYWFALPDGQPLACYLVEQNSDSNIYSAPIYLNNEITNLRIVLKYQSDSYTLEITGVWAGVDENGSASREIYSLKNGDIITPCYYAYDIESGDFYDYFYGDDYKYTGNNQIKESLLYEADYYYGFELYDIFENVLYTDFVLFGVEENGDISFYGEDDEEGNAWGWSDDFSSTASGSTTSTDYNWEDYWDDEYWNEYWDSLVSNDFNF